MKTDIDFAVTEGSLDALQKGLDIIAFGSEDEVSRFVSGINEYNSSAAKKIRYRLISLH